MNACASSDAPLAPGGQLLIGAATGVQASFTGYIDEVRIYDVAQSPARIAAEHASQRADDANPFVTFGASEAFRDRFVTRGKFLGCQSERFVYVRAPCGCSSSFSR